MNDPLLYVIRYAELALKGGNRPWFERMLMANLRSHFKAAELPCRITRLHGRLVVETEGDAPLAEAILAHIPGIQNFSPALTSSHDLNNMAQLGLGLVADALQDKPQETTFKVEASRSDKRFPLKSFELARELGSLIVPRFPQLKVKMTHPELTLGVEVWDQERSMLFLKKIPGQGGLPVGTAGNVMAFISGGIDSPVAAWMMMKRGCKLVYLTFHSYPFTPEASKQKVIDLVERLSRYQPHSTLLVVPFANIQKAIQQEAREKYRTILYRRMMFQVAEALKERYKIKAYLTGEAVGQVASQTLENLACTQDAASLPVLRPLIGMEKAEIVALAERIGTFQTSIQPYDDCCTLFQPKKPETHGRVETLREENARIPSQALIEEAISNLEVYHFEAAIKAKFWA